MKTWHRQNTVQLNTNLLLREASFKFCAYLLAISKCLHLKKMSRKSNQAASWAVPKTYPVLGTKLPLLNHRRPTLPKDKSRELNRYCLKINCFNLLSLAWTFLGSRKWLWSHRHSIFKQWGRSCRVDRLYLTLAFKQLLLSSWRRQLIIPEQ